jgi:FKBP-type peptidyl-prolyl cis-trans isomerase 2
MSARMTRSFNIALAFAILGLALLAGGCSASDSSDTTAPASSDPTFEATDGDIVEVHYVLTLDDGSVQDSSRDRGSTFTFTVGAGEVIRGFDAAVRGKKVGDVNTVRVEAVDGYGEWDEANIVEVPFNPEQGDIEVGDQVFLTGGQQAIVLEITDETVTLDANHPLAGEALTFEIEIVSITRP